MDEHQTKLHLQPFEEPAATAPAVAAAPAAAAPAAAAAAPGLPTRDEVLAGLVILERFVDHATCDLLVGIHRRFGRLTPTCDNGVPLIDVCRWDPEAFRIVKDVLARIQALIKEHFRQEVACDHTLVCALTTGGFRHTLHADNATVICPQHGGNAEALVRIKCECANIRVAPNHTAWRTHSALLYISDEHTGGTIVFGEGPNVYGHIYRKEIAPTRGLLVLSPSSELYFHHTTPVQTGVRYSMNSWFTSDPKHITRDWLADSPRSPIATRAPR